MTFLIFCVVKSDLLEDEIEADLVGTADDTVITVVASQVYAFSSK